RHAPCVKILVLGDSGVGKSSLVHLLTNHSELTNPAWTVGCSLQVGLHEYRSELTGQAERLFFLEFWDIGGYPMHKNSRGVAGDWRQERPVQSRCAGQAAERWRSCRSDWLSGDPAQLRGHQIAERWHPMPSSWTASMIRSSSTGCGPGPPLRLGLDRQFLVPTVNSRNCFTANKSSCSKLLTLSPTISLCDCEKDEQSKFLKTEKNVTSTAPRSVGRVGRTAIDGVKRIKQLLLLLLLQTRAARRLSTLKSDVAHVAGRELLLLPASAAGVHVLHQLALEAVQVFGALLVFLLSEGGLLNRLPFCRTRRRAQSSPTLRSSEAGTRPAPVRLMVLSCSFSLMMLMQSQKRFSPLGGCEGSANDVGQGVHRAVFHLAVHAVVQAHQQCDGAVLVHDHGVQALDAGNKPGLGVGRRLQLKEAAVFEQRLQRADQVVRLATLRVLVVRHAGDAAEQADLLAEPVIVQHLRLPNLRPNGDEALEQAADIDVEPRLHSLGAVVESVAIFEHLLAGLALIVQLEWPADVQRQRLSVLHERRRHAAQGADGLVKLPPDGDAHGQDLDNVAAGNASAEYVCGEALLVPMVDSAAQDDLHRLLLLEVDGQTQRVEVQHGVAVKHGLRVARVVPDEVWLVGDLEDLLEQLGPLPHHGGETVVRPATDHVDHPFRVRVMAA
uniref:Roc domain-containing protein n=1 Tax=Macrostomum lignano TaxID=282301 RepID=A0A1I8IN36_9PLAT